MTLTAADVAEIMRLVEQSGFDELNLEMEGTKISLRRGAAAGTAVAPSLARAAIPPSAPAGAAGVPASIPTLKSDPDVLDVAAPLLGTFYRAPKPGAAPFVEVGSTVETDSIIGIIEVMKLMNTVRAEVRGTVAQILAADGALVEFGETLLRVRKTA
jgi:acetyl-CoA carboxylase biotin carboxyl carrier protein